MRHLQELDHLIALASQPSVPWPVASRGGAMRQENRHCPLTTASRKSRHMFG